MHTITDVKYVDKENHSEQWLSVMEKLDNIVPDGLMYMGHTFRLEKPIEDMDINRLDYEIDKTTKYLEKLWAAREKKK